MLYRVLLLLQILMTGLILVARPALADDDNRFQHRRHFERHRAIEGYRPPPIFYPPPPVYYPPPPVYYPPPQVYEAPEDDEGDVPVYTPPYTPYGRHVMAHYCATRIGRCTLPGPQFAGRHCSCFSPDYGKMAGQSVP